MFPIYSIFCHSHNALYTILSIVILMSHIISPLVLAFHTLFHFCSPLGIQFKVHLLWEHFPSRYRHIFLWSVITRIIVSWIHPEAYLSKIFQKAFALRKLSGVFASGSSHSPFQNSRGEGTSSKENELHNAGRGM